MSDRVWWITGSCIFLLYVMMAIFVGDSLFSPDSWAYFELAQTVFSEDPYRFTTWRSYGSQEYSTSFPFGYPVFYGILLLFSSSHLISIWGNLLFVPATFLMLYLIGRNLKLAKKPMLLLAGSILLYPGYMIEILSGRSIPMALFFFLGAFWLMRREKYLFMGLALGVATLVRFDMLVASFLLGFGCLCLMKKRTKALWIVVGFLVSASPWILYSMMHFSKPWVSDNSWVAMSVHSAFVLDFPPEAKLTASQEPLQWLGRVLGNIPKLCVRVLIASLKFSALLGLVFLLFQKRDWFKTIQKSSLFVLGLIFISLAPYLLTGYFDERYFLPFFVALAMWGMVVGRIQGVGTFFFWVCWGLTGSWGMQQSLSMSLKRTKQNIHLDTHLDMLYQCHKAEPQYTYIFFGKNKKAGPQYGARYHMSSAVAPSNFEKMTQEEQQIYFSFMGKSRKIVELPADIPCQKK